MMKNELDVVMSVYTGPMIERLYMEGRCHQVEI